MTDHSFNHRLFNAICTVTFVIAAVGGCVAIFGGVWETQFVVMVGATMIFSSAILFAAALVLGVISTKDGK